MSNIMEVEKSPWLLNILKPFVTYSTVLAALSYLFGRSYFQGYFGTLGIDISFIQLSVFDYIENGWLSLWKIGVFWLIVLAYGAIVLTIYYFLAPALDVITEKYKNRLWGILFLISLSIIIYSSRYTIWNFISSLSLQVQIIGGIALISVLILIYIRRKVLKKKFSDFLEMHRQSPHYMERADTLMEFGRKINFQGTLFLFLLLFTYLMFSANAKDYGIQQASIYLNEKAYQVEIVSLTPLFSENIEEINIYIQSDLRFLYFNNGKYFVAKLDESCKPKDIYVINEKDIINIHMNIPTQDLLCTT